MTRDPMPPPRARDDEHSERARNFYSFRPYSLSNYLWAQRAWAVACATLGCGIAIACAKLIGVL